MKKFMLNFRMSAQAAASMDSVSPEQMAESLQQWSSWIAESINSGKFVATNRLDSGGVVLTGPNAVVSDGPYIEVKDFLGGYIIITASDIEEASAYAKGCPILQIGGNVEIRPIMSLE